ISTARLTYTKVVCPFFPRCRLPREVRARNLHSISSGFPHVLSLFSQPLADILYSGGNHPFHREGAAGGEAGGGAQLLLDADQVVALNPDSDFERHCFVLIS